MKNLEIYNAVRAVPDEAKSPIKGGRLKGLTDINPMWRIKALTEQFGPCGLGWVYEIVKQWTEPGAPGEIAVFCNINLFVMMEGDMSRAIPGTGGSMLVSKEKGGLYTSDECYKMALTDAISVACKALGMGADVYWSQGVSKYGRINEENETNQLIKQLYELAEEYQRLALITKACTIKSFEKKLNKKIRSFTKIELMGAIDSVNEWIQQRQQDGD